MTKIAEINGLIILGDGPTIKSPSGQNQHTYLLRCYCGKEFTSRKNNVNRGHTKSCGCRKPPSYHGERGSAIYRRWDSMIQRCTNQNAKAYKNYGARGITVCEEWRSYLIFREWAETSGFSPELELDRKDNNLGYSPENCRWISHSQNNRNKRDNHLLEYNGEVKTIAEWCEIYKHPFKRVESRINRLGWSIHDALTKQPGTRKGVKSKKPMPKKTPEQLKQHSENIKRGWIKRRLKAAC